MCDGLIKEILDIKIYNNSLLKILAVTSENKIIMLETLIDINSLSIELFLEERYDIKNALTQETISNYIKTKERGKIELKIIKDKNNDVLKIKHITKEILDKFTEESEEI